MILSNERVTATTRTHATSELVTAQVAERFGVSEIDDSVALAIASWFQSPGTAAGVIFAELSTTGSVVVGELHDAIAVEYREPYDHATKQALDMLGTWSLNHPSRVS